jgi:hypothetical protein
MAHEIDEIGLPVDPELKRLQLHLGYLAADWGSYESEERQREIVEEYHATLNLLYSLGWDAALSIDSELPDALMPEEYLRRNPSYESGELTLSTRVNEQLKNNSLERNTRDNA